MTFKLPLAIAAALGLGLSPIAASAQDSTAETASVLRLELNSAGDTESGGCRLTFVAINETDVDLSRTGYEVGVFDANGIVTRLLVLELGALSPGKTRILQFDLAGSSCSGISRIIVNAIAGCTIAETGAEDTMCLTELETSSLAQIQFGL